VSTVRQILALYERGGAAMYFGERVSMTEHALQAAYFAREQDAAAPLVLAALLHDIGHLLEDVPADIADWTTDGHHEAVGGAWLARRFGPAVSEPVLLHVPAKRYLCATDSHYFSKLSAASVHTLELQGGPMGAEEVARFESQPFFKEALLVRRCDDLGKVAGLTTPPLDEYLALIEELAIPQA
jgi:phosphonate degradation associated HDIG domain protein